MKAEQLPRIKEILIAKGDSISEDRKERLRRMVFRKSQRIQDKVRELRFTQRNRENALSLIDYKDDPVAYGALETLVVKSSIELDSLMEETDRYHRFIAYLAGVFQDPRDDSGGDIKEIPF